VLTQGGGRSRSLAPRALATLLGSDVFPASGFPGGHGAAPDGPDPDSGALGGRLRLFALSFLMLFVELALIRWLGANVVYLSYYSNFVLLGSFLGIGIGFLRARSRVNLFPWAPAALTLLVYFVLRFPVQVTNASAQLVFFGSGSSLKTTGLPTWETLPVVFIAVATVMAMIGEGVARSFARFRPLDAYRLDILGSIAGIIAFSALSFANAKPLVWALVVALTFVLLFGLRIGVLQIAAVASLVVLLGAESLGSADVWSPYYRISLTTLKGGQYGISVNGIPHQGIVPARHRAEIFYTPYRQAPANHLGNVLVIGAGGGNDVAIALKQGAKHVDAVEIDPQIYADGKRLNPDHPYQDPRVSPHINDGRAFLQQSRAMYDLILFALPDSLTLVSGQSSLRLESYLFTQQAVAAAALGRRGPQGDPGRAVDHPNRTHVRKDSEGCRQKTGRFRDRAKKD